MGQCELFEFPPILYYKIIKNFKIRATGPTPVYG